MDEELKYIYIHAIKNIYHVKEPDSWALLRVRRFVYGRLERENAKQSERNERTAKRVQNIAERAWQRALKR